jgi:hypothetical protein
LTLILLVALLGGLAMAAVAGARRTQSAFPTYLASTHPSDITVLSSFDDPALGLASGYDPALIAKIAHLPGVAGLATYVGFDGNIDNITGIHLKTGAGQSPPAIEGSFDGEFTTQDQLGVQSGRMFDPKRTDEAVMNASAAEGAGLHIGSVVSFSLYTDKEEAAGYNGPAHRFVHVKIVGVVLFSRDVVEDDVARLTSAAVLMTPALTRQMAPDYSYYSYSALRLVRGAAGDAKVQEEVAGPAPKQLGRGLSDGLDRGQGRAGGQTGVRRLGGVRRHRRPGSPAHRGASDRPPPPRGGGGDLDPPSSRSRPVCDLR